MRHNNWCLFRNSIKVKTAIKFLMKERSLSASDIAKIAGVRLHRISNYLNHPHSAGKSSITQEQLMRICMKLGINVIITVSYDG
jgi:transcriptional regulator with XRE-family HTH domain